jgi:hypothetical protein
MVAEGYLEDLWDTALPVILVGVLCLVLAVACWVLGARGRPWLLAVAGAVTGVGFGGLLVGSVRIRWTRKGAESLAGIRGYLEQLREDLDHQLKMAPIQAAEFLFANLPWLTLDPRYYGTQARKLHRRLKKDHGELRPVSWAIDRTRAFQKATASMSRAYTSFYPFFYVSGGAGRSVAPSAAGGAVGGAGGGGAAGGGGGGAG